MASIHGTDSTILAVQIKRALLAVEELGEGPVLALDAQGDPLLVAPLLERRPGDVEADGVAALGLGRFGDQLLLVDVGVPGQVGLAVPLGVLGLLVELVELGPGALLVVPGEDGVVVRVHDVAAVGILGARPRRGWPRGRRSPCGR